MTQVILFNKPFRVLCQFSPHEEKTTLANYISEKGFYPCGRLDYDSEGLLILSNNGSLQSLISQPKHKMTKTYAVQVEGDISPKAIAALEKGVELKDGLTKPARARVMEQPQWLWPRQPPVRERKMIPTSWLELTISEGKNRQVRRMTAAVGFPTLRLIRTAVGPWSLSQLDTGEWQFAGLSPDLEKRLSLRDQKRKQEGQAPGRQRSVKQGAGKTFRGSPHKGKSTPSARGRRRRSP